MRHMPTTALGHSRPHGIALLAGLTFLTGLGAATVDAQVDDRVRVRSWDVGPAGPLPYDLGAAGVWQRLQKVGNLASVLYTTGHPDDEEAGVLTRLSRGLGARTALLTLNRGEGGANAIGPELFDALGLIRTEELRLSGRYYGLDDQYFTTAADYGYSKTLDEAMRSWDRDAVVEDMARIIRINRPLVVISRWHGSERDGHGHHQAAGVLTYDAVEAAADPRRFPEQITEEGLRPWQVHRILRGGLLQEETAWVEVQQDRVLPWLGTSPGDLGAYGLSLQRSQTQGRVRGGPRPPARYQRRQLPWLASALLRMPPQMGGPAPDTSVLAGLPTSLPSLFDAAQEPADPETVTLLEEAEALLSRARGAFDLRDPGAVVPDLATARAVLASAAQRLAPESDAAWLLAVERRELDEALVAALGVELSAVAVPVEGGTITPVGPVVPGRTVWVRARAGIEPRASAVISTVRLDVPNGWPAPERLAESSSERADHLFAMTVPSDAEPTRPWHHRASIADNMYSVRDSADLHLGETRPPVHAVATVQYALHTLEVRRPVRVVESRAPYGSVTPTLSVVPALSVSAAPRAVVRRPEQETVPVTVDVLSSEVEAVEVVVGLDVPPRWTVEPAERAVRFEGAGEHRAVTFQVRPPTGGGRATLTAHATVDGRTYREGHQRIVHRDLAPMVLYRDATADVVPVDVAVAPDLRIGYVMGVGDEVPTAIEQLGAEVTLLDAEALAGGGSLAVTGATPASSARDGGGDLSGGGGLDQYDAIVVGTRAYAVRPDLVANNRRLLDYARAGGHVVVLYQTQEFTPETQAPYPASLPPGAEEVSEEDAPVRLLAPDHPLLTTPNRITERDFDGWIEQRGSKHFASWDVRYTPLIESHDTGQAPQQGIWVTTEVGEGRWTYASIALHRQLPYAVPGAVRILANLLSAGRVAWLR